jgi:hypothetical protein
VKENTQYESAFVGLEPVKTIEPNEKLTGAYQEAYKRWEEVLKHQLKREEPQRHEGTKKN